VRYPLSTRPAPPAIMASMSNRWLVLRVHQNWIRLRISMTTTKSPMIVCHQAHLAFVSMIFAQRRSSWIH